MLDTESTAMETNGNAYFPAEGQAAEWSAAQVSSEQLSTVMPEASDPSQDAPGQEQQPMNSELGSVEKAVEQFQLANAELFQGEHPPPPPPPPPIDGTEQTELAPPPEESVQDSSQGI